VAVGELFLVYAIWVLHRLVVVINGCELRGHNLVELGALITRTMNNV
jgi:hypothetical protein